MQKEDISCSDQQPFNKRMEQQWEKVAARDKTGSPAFNKPRQRQWDGYLARSDRRFSELVANVTKEQTFNAALYRERKMSIARLTNHRPLNLYRCSVFEPTGRAG
jgi:hypothetical protein